MTRASERRGRRALVAGVLLGLVCVPLARDAVRAPGVIGHGDAIVRDVLLWALLGAAGAACLLRAPRRGAVVAALLVGVVLRVAAVPDKAPLSDDLYRYAWDGRVQASGTDPYRYAPDDPALSALRDPEWLWPPTACPEPPADCQPRTLINRPSVPTIYPPVAQLWFLALHVSGVTRGSDTGLALAGLGVDLATLAALLAVLRRTGRDERYAAFWALSPLPVLETVADAHVDGLALLVVLAALAVDPARRPARAGALLAVAALVKLYPAVLLPALLARTARRPRLLAAGALVAGLAYLPHVLAVGPGVLGYLPGYLQEERYGSGDRLLLLTAAGVPPGAAGAVAGLVLLAVAVVVLRRRPEPLIGGVALLGALLLLTTPVQPWYAVTLGGIAVAAARPEWLAVGVAGYPGYVATLLDRDATLVATTSYASAAALVALCALSRRAAARSRTRPSPPRTPPAAGSPTPPPPARTTP